VELEEEMSVQDPDPPTELVVEYCQVYVKDPDPPDADAEDVKAATSAPDAID
jgi:hypothetical protein